MLKEQNINKALSLNETPSQMEMISYLELSILNIVIK